MEKRGTNVKERDRDHHRHREDGVSEEQIITGCGIGSHELFSAKVLLKLCACREVPEVNG